MTKYYHIIAKMLSPLMIQKKRQTGTPQTLEYLPGSTLKGALAAAFLRSGGSPSSLEFKRLFLEKPVHFCDLLPTRDAACISSVLPKTAVSCKREPGFDKHGVFDTFADTAACRMENVPPDQLTWACPHIGCGEDMKPFGGFWNGSLEAPEKIDPGLVVNRHTGIDRVTGTVANGMFYITQAMADYYKDDDAHDARFHPQFLNGGVYLDAQQADFLASLTQNTIFAGADRSRGFGELSLTIESVINQDAVIPSSKAMDKWSRIFKKRLKRRMTTPPPPGFYFSVNLASHAVLLDRFLRPVSDIDALNLPDITEVTRVAGAETVNGWHSAMGLARPDDVATAMGSVYLFCYTGENMDKLTSLLRELVITGIGLRRDQGYGRISVCDPLHILKEDI